MIARCTILIALLAGAWAGRAVLDAPRAVTTAEPLGRFPSTLGTWTGKDLPLAPEVIKVAAVDDHLNRQYRSRQGSIGLYIGYYQSQRQGEALHSPLFCLPGSGWQPVSNERVDLTAADGSARSVNRLVVERGLDRLTVLYWYQMFARVTASEVLEKTVSHARRLLCRENGRRAGASHRADRLARNRQ